MNGTLEGLSLVGNKGGSITMAASNITIAPSPGALPSAFTADSALPQNLQGQLVFGAGQLDQSGFTRITLKSVNDLVMQSGTLGPSLVKLATPLPGSGALWLVPGVSSATGANSGTVLVTQDQIGATSISLSAGTNGSGLTYGTGAQNGPMNPVRSPNNLNSLLLSPGASIQAGPGGSITMTAPIIDIGGLLDAPAGSITLTSLQVLNSSGNNLTLEPGAMILAEGYIQPGTAPVKGLPAQATPLAGGTVSLTTPGNGDLILSPGSLISVSGSSPVQQTVVGDDGTLSSITNASQPGTISLTTGRNLTLGGDLRGQASIPGLAGGTLSVATTSPTLPLSLAMSDLARFRDSGFDALTLSSAGTLNLSNPAGLGQVAFGRSLTLNAQTITGSGRDQINLSAPWVQVTNSNSAVSSAPSSSGNGAGITLAGSSLTGSGFLDVTGNVVFSGFTSVSLLADRDMRLSDALYTNGRACSLPRGT